MQFPGFTKSVIVTTDGHVNNSDHISTDEINYYYGPSTISLVTLKQPNMKLQRWKIKLSEDDYNIFKKRVINKNTNVLSRIEINNQYFHDSIDIRGRTR